MGILRPDEHLNRQAQICAEGLLMPPCPAQACGILIDPEAIGIGHAGVRQAIPPSSSKAEALHAMRIEHCKAMGELCAPGMTEDIDGPGNPKGMAALWKGGRLSCRPCVLHQCEGLCRSAQETAPRRSQEGIYCRSRHIGFRYVCA